MPLTDTEEQITKAVVERFTNSNQATKRKALVTKFRSPQSLDRLIGLEILKPLDKDDDLVPTSVGVEYSKDPDSITRAKLSVRVVLQALQSLYDVTPARKPIYRHDFLKEVSKLQGETVPEVTDRGLYLVRELSVLDSYGPAPGPRQPTPFDLEWLVISENIVTVDVNAAWDEHIRTRREAIDSGHGKTATAPGNSQPGDRDTDRQFARMAVEEARKSVSENDGRPRPKVGAVVVKDGQVICVAYRGEFPGNHAEYIALEKKARDLPLAGATVYTTLEPCTTRNHPKVPCAVRLAERKVARVVVGMLDPDTRITGKGQRQLRQHNIITDLFPHDLMAEIEEMNREFTQFCEQQQMADAEKPKTPEVVGQIPSKMEDETEAGDERDQGRRWLEKLLTRLLAERGLRLDSPIRWTPDFDREIYTLEARMGGSEKIWRLSYEALEDCVADKNVQRTIERALRMYFVPDPE